MLDERGDEWSGTRVVFSGGRRRLGGGLLAAICISFSLPENGGVAEGDGGGARGHLRLVGGGGGGLSAARAAQPPSITGAIQHSPLHPIFQQRAPALVPLLVLLEPGDDAVATTIHD